jgi:hypothetical protein
MRKSQFLGDGARVLRIRRSAPHWETTEMALKTVAVVDEQRQWKWLRNTTLAK